MMRRSPKSSPRPGEGRGSQRGFTLLEMMVAIAVVGILAALVTQGLPFLKEKTRDRRRRYELASMQRVIEIYKADTGSYPALPDGSGGYYSFFATNDAFAAWGASLGQVKIGENYIPNVVPTYYEKLPEDPLPGESKVSGCQAMGYQKNIAYFSNGEHYKLVYFCANESGDIDPTDYFADPLCMGGPCWAWAVSDNLELTTWTLGWW